MKAGLRNLNVGGTGSATGASGVQVNDKSNSFGAMHCVVQCERDSDMIYLLTAIGLSPGGRSTVHIYTQTVHRTIQNKQYIEQHNNFGRVRAVPRLG